MHNLCPMTTLLVFLLVHLLCEVAFARPVYSAGEDLALSQSLAIVNNQTDLPSSSSSSSSSSEFVDKNAQNTDTQTISNAALPADFVQDESQYQAILEQLRKEAADSILLDLGNFVAPDATVEEIMKLVGQAEIIAAAAFQEQPSAAAAALLEEKEREVECAICLESLSEASSGHPVAVACGHTFHADCIEQWKQEKRSQVPCPLCRTDIDTTSAPQFVELPDPSRRQSADEPIRVFIETSRGNLLGTYFLPSATVFDVKKFIFDKDHIPSRIQIISFNGRTLNDEDKTLEYYGVNARSTLVQRLPGADYSYVVN